MISWKSFSSTSTASTRHTRTMPGATKTSRPAMTGAQRSRPALNAAAYTVLFVNIEFRASSFINEVELPALLHAAEREGLVLLPLLVGDCQLPCNSLFFDVEASRKRGIGEDVHEGLDDAGRRGLR
ncbi:hypothetical protein U5801_24005 [Lamprobacter modestohalophilus]|uniref:hypothetical protein n=1 Tax=Lamprobacter modestohalophilus TaxID=1064514 RepID=UPI002ADEE174|nr:hypothetical protein [Lamprobacter modestohalophilus]MEA1052849.1 hypothetical protein [Lamprobacter modestohalophilus]